MIEYLLGSVSSLMMVCFCCALQYARVRQAGSAPLHAVHALRVLSVGEDLPEVQHPRGESPSFILQRNLLPSTLLFIFDFNNQQP